MKGALSILASLLLALPAGAEEESSHDQIRRAAKERQAGEKEPEHEEQAESEEDSQATGECLLAVVRLFVDIADEAVRDSRRPHITEPPEDRRPAPGGWDYELQTWAGYQQILQRSYHAGGTIRAAALVQPFLLVSGELTGFAEKPGSHPWDTLGLGGADLGLGYLAKRSGAVVVGGYRGVIGGGVPWHLFDLGLQAWYSPDPAVRLDGRALGLLGSLGPDADLMAGISWTPRWAALRLGWRAVSLAGQWLQGPELSLAVRVGP